MVAVGAIVSAARPIVQPESSRQAIKNSNARMGHIGFEDCGSARSGFAKSFKFILIQFLKSKSAHAAALIVVWLRRRCAQQRAAARGTMCYVVWI